MKNIIYTLSLLFIISSCKKSQPVHEPINPKNEKLIYAESLTWQENDNNLVLNNEGNITQLPISKLPLKNVILLSSSAIGYIESLGALDQVQGVFDVEWYYSPTLHTLINQGKIEDLGKSAAPDVEKILQLNPDAVITYTQPEKAKFLKLLENQGIEIIYIDEYKEKEALAKVEYLKLYGKLLGKENIADSLFTVIDKNYKALKNSVQNENRPSVFTNIMRGDVWYMSGGKSFTAQYIEDAGAHFIWSDDTHPGNITLSFEEVYQKAKDADYWLNTSDFTKLEQLKNTYKNNEFFKAFKNANVYTFSKRTNETGANDYFETGTVRADWVLNDLIKIFHPEKATEHEFKFYQKLK